MHQPPEHRADLAVTALYTAETWRWAGFPGADQLAGLESAAVFRWTNRFLRLARWLRPDAPALAESLAQRHQVIDALVAASGAPTVLELAAGLSPRCLALSAHPERRCVEVDLPPVIAFKRRQLERTPEGRAALARDNLTLVGADVREVDLPGLIDPGQPVCVVVEGLLMYLDPEAQRALWSRLAACLRHPDSVLLFDLTPTPEQPPPGRVGRLAGWLMGRFTRGRGIVRDDRDRAALRRDLAAAGLTDVATFDPATPPPGCALGWTDVPTAFVVWRARASWPNPDTHR